jgi:hypothetical protein
MFIRIKGQKILVRLLIATTATGLVALAYNPRALADSPLQASDIIRHWEENPQQDVQAYIELTVRRRKIGFFPTNGVRRELCDNLVPIEVIDALKFNFHDSSKFHFQVWMFETKAQTLTTDQAKLLAENIIQQIRNQNSGLSDVFQHFKPPLPDPCAQPRNPDSSGCVDSNSPVLRVKGTIERSGARLKAVVRLAYVSTSVGPSPGQPIGSEPRTTVFEPGGEGLMRAATEIVRKLHESLKQEMTEPFNCQTR